MRMKGMRAGHYDSGPNMTPLVDVVMVILIFLMLAGKFGADEHYLASSIPIRQKGTPVKTQVVPNDVNLKITVDAASDRFIAHIEGIDQSFTEPQQLTDALSQRLAQYVANGQKPDDVQVLIAPGLTVKYNSMIQVYAAALAAETNSGGQKVGFTKVAFESDRG